MKKLLAIAVAAAITIPMTAMAETKASGSARMLLDLESPATLGNNSSHFRLTGSNGLDNGLSLTHKFEFGADPTNIAGGVSNRSSFVGLKSGFGEVRVGSDWTPMDKVDDGAGVLVNGSGTLQPTDGNRKGTIQYIGKFGGAGVMAMVRPKGNYTTTTTTTDETTGAVTTTTTESGTKAQLGLTYKAGPIYAGLGVGSNAGDADGTMDLALAYSGANYKVGYVYGNDGGDDKSNSVRGKYSVGKAWIAGMLTKKGDDDHKALDLGYGIGKGAKVYLQFKKTNDDDASKAIGLQQDF